MNLDPTNYLETWKYFAHMAALSLVFLACANIIFYVLVTALIGNRTKKYHFVLNNETTVMFVSAIGISLAIALVFNVFMLNERDFAHLFVFSIKAGLPIGLGVTIGYGFKTYLNVSYQNVLDKKLADIRFTERKHPETKASMRLLNEDEEDAYLTEEMIQQEEDMAYDFDVWIDDKTGKTIIETYKGSTNKVCNKCHFRTLKLVKEEVSESTKMKTKFYACSHCG
ncbi:MAG: hypothetical protein OCD76_11465, partial [Reichenbachiella sp.]